MESDSWVNVCRRLIIAGTTRRLAANLTACPVPETYQFVEDPVPGLSRKGAQDFRECFVEDSATGEIRFTAKGLDRFSWLFARAAIDINNVRSRRELHIACEQSVHILANDLKEIRTGTLDQLEGALLYLERHLRATA